MSFPEVAKEAKRKSLDENGIGFPAAVKEAKSLLTELGIPFKKN